MQTQRNVRKFSVSHNRTLFELFWEPKTGYFIGTGKQGASETAMSNCQAKITR